MLCVNLIWYNMIWYDCASHHISSPKCEKICSYGSKAFDFWETMSYADRSPVSTLNTTRTPTPDSACQHLMPSAATVKILWEIFQPNLAQSSTTRLSSRRNLPNSLNAKIKDGGGRHIELRKMSKSADWMKIFALDLVLRCIRLPEIIRKKIEPEVNSLVVTNRTSATKVGWT